jgi:putative NADPH-quinone reductase
MDMLMVTAHPDPASFCHAVSAAAKAGLERAGHHVTQLDLYGIGFEPAMGVDEHRAYMARVTTSDELVRRHGELLHSVTGLVFVYPTWWSGPPAVLRGWLERVFVPGVAFDFDGNGKLRPGLTHIRRIIGISTYGSPWTYVKIVNDNGRRMITRALRLNCGRHTSTTWLGLYSIDTTGDNERRAFLDRVGHTMANVK